MDKQGKSTIQESILKELRPDGMINASEEVLKHLDHTGNQSSLVIPVKYNKDGTLAKSSKAVTEEEFYRMMRHALKKVEEITGQIMDGKTQASPYRNGDETGCDFCKYRHICGFDVKIPGFEYRDIDKMKKEDALQAMKQEGEE